MCPLSSGITTADADLMLQLIHSSDRRWCRNGYLSHKIAVVVVDEFDKAGRTELRT